MSDIDTGDHVLHRPTGESWIVAYVQGDRLAWVGWPGGTAAVADCEVIERASPEDRLRVLRNMAQSTGDRARYARALLGVP